MTPAPDPNITQSMEHILCRVLSLPAPLPLRPSIDQIPASQGANAAELLNQAGKQGENNPKTETCCAFTSPWYTRANASELLRPIESSQSRHPRVQISIKSGCCALDGYFQKTPRRIICVFQQCIVWENGNMFWHVRRSGEVEKMSLICISDSHNNHGNWALLVLFRCFEYIFIFDILWGVFWYLVHESAMDEEVQVVLACHVSM